MFSFLNNIPQVTKNLLLINVVLYLVMMVFLQIEGPDLSDYLSSHYVLSPLFEPYQSITHMFMHSKLDLSHILFNMLLLVIFGSHLERVWGMKRYFIFYMAAGIGAFLLDNIVQGVRMVELQELITQNGISMDAVNNVARQSGFYIDQSDIDLLNQIKNIGNAPESVVTYIRMCNIEGVGASGAIFGLLAAFAILFPNTELYLMFIPIPIKAKFLIGAYVAYELYQSIFVAYDSVNHLAHIGGALTGTILVLIWRYRDKQNFY